MTTTTAEPDLVPCACGCGEEVKPSTRSKDGRSWKRGHYLKNAAGKLSLLPGPDDDLDEPDDLDEIDVPVTDDDLDVPGWLRDGASVGAEVAPEVKPDRPPGRLREPRRREPAGKRKPVTAALKREATANVKFAVRTIAEVWALRDPVCGPVAIEAEPNISDAFATIVLDSPGLTAFFTGGQAAGFMKYVKLAFALQPVILVARMHHLTPTHEGRQPGQGCGVCGAEAGKRCRLVMVPEGQDYRQYAA